MNGNKESEKSLRVLTSPKLPEANYLNLPETSTESHGLDTSNLTLFKLDPKVPKITIFMQSLQDQVQRISPSFILKNTGQPPLDQALSVLKQAIDTFLERYSKLYSADNSFNKSISQEREESRSKIKINNQEGVKTAEDTMKNLCRYEQLLKKKEWKLNDEKKIVLEETENLKIIEENMRQVAEAFEDEKSMWLTKKNSEKEAIENEKKKLAAEKTNIEKIIEDFKQMQGRLDSKNAETARSLQLREDRIRNLEDVINKKSEEISKEKFELSQQKNKLEQEKWNINQMQHINEEKEALLSLKAKYLNLDKTEFENEKSNSKCKLEEDHKRLSIDKELFRKEQQSTDRTSEADLFNYSSDHSISSQYHDQKSHDLCIREQEIDQAYSELTDQMTRFNQELDEREHLIFLNSEKLLQKEQELNRQYLDFKSIKACLVDSKQEMEAFRLNVIPQLEEQSRLLSDLLLDLLGKKDIMEHTINKLNKELHTVKIVKGNLEIISEAPSESSSDESPSPVTSYAENTGENFGKYAMNIINMKFEKDSQAYRRVEEIVGEKKESGGEKNERNSRELEADKEAKVENEKEKEQIEVVVKKVLMKKRHDLPFTKLAISKTIDKVLCNFSELNGKSTVHGEEKK